MDGNDREQHQTSDGQDQLTAHQARRQLLIPSLLQTNRDVQQRTQRTCSSTEFAWKPKFVPVQTDVGKTVDVEVARSLDHVQSPDGMNNDEKYQEDGTTGKLRAAVPQKCAPPAVTRGPACGS